MLRIVMLLSSVWLVGCGVESDLVLPPAAFTVQLGIDVAPVALPARTTVIGAMIDVQCPDAPNTLVLTCARAADPLDPGTAQAWCGGAVACGASPSSLPVPMPSVNVSPRRAVELVVASPELASVEVLGAVVTVDR